MQTIDLYAKERAKIHIITSFAEEGYDWVKMFKWDHYLVACVPFPDELFITKCLCKIVNQNILVLFKQISLALEQSTQNLKT